ncbi:hypothetical protein HNQ94_001528 [Salirhabdus euzebyi]|uniref:DUF3298 domain-containing protein n=1 Tax=Salirhabdus euzebyi TaxID=394506 RepID=A0A841Q414_9BACI|nr:DUF4163 domain-containing protein [Salirhabdus euzebyi]MBB6453080.1 hypothetical protein [Salirhabdus euzebyi]
MKKGKQQNIFKGVVFLALCLFFTPQERIQAESIAEIIAATDKKSAEIEFKKVKDKKTAYEIDIKIPVFHNMKDMLFQMKLNHELKKRANEEKKEFIKEAKEKEKKAKGKKYSFKQHKLVVNPKVMMNSKIISLMSENYVYKGENNEEQKINTLNIWNGKQGKVLTFASIFDEDADYKAEINNIIAKQIEARKENGESNLKGIDNFKSVKKNQKYYLKENTVVVIFEQFEQPLGYVGVPSFSIPVQEIENIIRPDIYRVLMNN